MRKLNELEGVVVGVIYREQPCTAYAVRVVLKSSPSTHWQASAGAIYPLLARLEKEQLIVSAPDKDDGRGRQLLSITPLGKRALKAWIRDISRPEPIAEMHDPLRTRIFFLGALSAKEQEKFADDTLNALDRHLAVTKAHLADRPADEELFEHLGALGGVVNTESRIELLKTVQTKIKTNQARRYKT